MLGSSNLKLEDGEDPPSEMPSVAGPSPLDTGSGVGALPFEPPADPVVRRFQEEMSQVDADGDSGEGQGALIKQEGKVYHVRNVATVQRWIVERRVLRDDLISTGGAGWEPVGQHPDLEIFFQMVERLDQLEQGGGGAHKVGPPVPDSAALGNAWADGELEEPDESSLPMPDEEEDEEESDIISAPSELPSDVDSAPSEIDSMPSGPLVELGHAPPVEEEPALGPEVIEDPDSDIAPLPFALRSAAPTEAQPAQVTVPEVVATEEVPIPGTGLIGMVGDAPEEEVTQGRVTSPAPELPPIAPLPVGIGPGDSFDEQAFFDPDLEPLRVPDPEPTLAMAQKPAANEPDPLAWEEDRRERRLRVGLRVGVILVLLLLGGIFWVMQEPSGPGIAANDPDPSGDPSAALVQVDPDVDPAEGVTAPEDEAASDKAAADKAAADKAAADKAAADKAAADKAAADKAAADKAAADKAAADKAAKETRAASGPPKERPAPAVNTDKGWDAVQAGDYNQARLVFVEAVAAKPGNADAHFGLGYAAHRQGDDSTAIRHYCKALKLAPGNREIQQEANSLLSSLDATCP